MAASDAFRRLPIGRVATSQSGSAPPTVVHLFVLRIALSRPDRCRGSRFRAHAPGRDVRVYDEHEAAQE